MSTAPLPRSCAASNPDAASDRLLADTLLATDAGLNPSEYLSCRAASATHAEALAAEVDQLWLPDYAQARLAGLTHHQVIELNDRLWSPFIQVEVVRSGVTPTELADVIAANPNLTTYRAARQAGHDHNYALARASQVHR
jgi:hypothetical protein